MEKTVTQAVYFPCWAAAVSCTYLFAGQLTRCSEKTLSRIALNVVPFLLNLYSRRIQRWLYFAYKRNKTLVYPVTSHFISQSLNCARLDTIDLCSCTSHFHTSWERTQLCQNFLVINTIQSF